MKKMLLFLSFLILATHLSAQKKGRFINPFDNTPDFGLIVGYNCYSTEYYTYNPSLFENSNISISTYNVVKYVGLYGSVSISSIAEKDFSQYNKGKRQTDLSNWSPETTNKMNQLFYTDSKISFGITCMLIPRLYSYVGINYHTIKGYLETEYVQYFLNDPSQEQNIYTRIKKVGTTSNVIPCFGINYVPFDFMSIHVGFESQMRFLEFGLGIGFMKYNNSLY